MTENEILAFPLSFAQQRLWVLDRLEPDSSVYNIPIALRLTGELNVEALQRSLSFLVARHEILRARFEQKNGTPVQIIDPARGVHLSETDLASLAPQEQEIEARRLVSQAAQSPFDLSRGPLFRVLLFRLSDNQHILVLTIHHIVFDGWSGRIFLRELMSCYQAFCAGQAPELPELRLQYADYSVWQQENFTGGKFKNDLDFWKRQLTDAPSTIGLPTDYPRPVRQSFQGSKLSVSVSPSVLEGLKQLSRREGVTLFMTVLAAFKLLLARYSGQDDIVVGSPITGRNRVELENVIGFFVNTVVLRTDLSGNPSFRRLLARTRETVLNAFAHQDLPFERLVEELKPDRDLSRNPIFQVMFAFQNTPAEIPRAEGLCATGFEQAERASSKFDLTLTATEKSGQLRLAFEYSTDLFHCTTISRMQQHFQNLLEAIVDLPDCAIADLPLMSSQEEHQVVVEWNQTTTPYERTLCLHTAFERQAANTAEQTAILFEGSQLTFREVNQRANQLAHFLISKGIRPGALVGVALERSAEMVVALLGVLKTGAAYVPLDPSYPAQRLAYLLDDSQAQVVLSNEAISSKLPPTAAEPVLLDLDADLIAKQKETNPSVTVNSESLAYVVYTSGSTGNPKGVEGTHRASINRCVWMWKRYPFEPGEICCHKTTLGFVDSIWEIFGSLLHGIPLLVVPQETVLDPEKFIRILAQHEIRRLVIVPSQLRTLLEFEGNLRERLPKLNLWSASGEALPVDLVQRFFEVLPGARMLNIYGSSETAGDATWHEVSPSDTTTVPIGRPLDNTQVYVLDRHLHPVPVGVVGQIYVGGDCLARGYWKRPALTAEKFIPNPFAPERSPCLYSIGDLGRYMPDGTLLFLGRSDHQVKIRGYRIELGEIESVLEGHKSVQQAAVVLRDFAGEQRLVAYAIPKPGEQILTSELRSHLEKTVPAYMIPAAFMILDRFPSTTSGKVNRLALPAPEQAKDTPILEPRNETEATLLRIWKTVLGVSRIGVNENFFELGGHSLLAIRLVAEIRQETGQEIPLATLFERATIGRLADVLLQGKKPTHAMTVAVQAEGFKPPFFGVVVPGANPLGYAALARHLGKDQPIYTIQGPGPRLRNRPYTPGEFEGLAADYINVMRTIQPHGPYYFGGMCEGARIAFDMARILESRGEEVALLAIFDTWVLENSQIRSLWKLDYYGSRVRWFWRKSRQDKLAMLRQWFQHRSTQPPPRPWATTYWPGKNFIPPKIRADVSLFRLPRQPYFYVRDPEMGWGSRTTGKVDSHVLPLQPKRHNLLFREPCVTELARHLRNCLERAAANKQDDLMLPSPDELSQRVVCQADQNF